MNPDDPRHGTLNGYNKLGCRCQRCRNAQAAQARKLRESNRQGLRKGTLNPEHGKNSTYQNYACRCEPCKEAASKTMKAYYRRVHS